MKGHNKKATGSFSDLRSPFSLMLPRPCGELAPPLPAASAGFSERGHAALEARSPAQKSLPGCPMTHLQNLRGHCPSLPFQQILGSHLNQKTSEQIDQLPKKGPRFDYLEVTLTILSHAFHLHAILLIKEVIVVVAWGRLAAIASCKTSWTHVGRSLVHPIVGGHILHVWRHSWRSREVLLRST